MNFCLTQLIHRYFLLFASINVPAYLLQQTVAGFSPTHRGNLHHHYFQTTIQIIWNVYTSFKLLTTRRSNFALIGKIFRSYIDWLIDWLVDWFDWYDWFDRLIDRLLIERLINELLEGIDWFIDWLIDWRIDWCINWLIDVLIDWLIDWLIHWLIDGLIDWRFDRLIDWLID